MQLIGLLDSPYVRRVAVSMQLMGCSFEHRPISVFRGFEEFRAINPVVKAPTLVCAYGTVLMDSSLILEYLEAVSPRSLKPRDTLTLQADLRVTGLALAALDKSVQLIYERELRPPDKQHEPWVSRVTGQMLAALSGLEADLRRRPLKTSYADITQAGVTVAVSWHFIQRMLPQLVPVVGFTALTSFSAEAEQLAAFKAAPHGEATCVPVLEPH